MKKLLFILLFLGLAAPCFAQCVAEVKSVTQDPLRGSIVVETEYTLNGIVVQTGNTRYLETSGTQQEIEDKIKSDIDDHCKNLIKRIPQNQDYINSNILERQKELTQELTTNLSKSIVGYSTTKSDSVINFKNKDIKVTYDSKNSISDNISPVVIGE